MKYIYSIILSISFILYSNDIKATTPNITSLSPSIGANGIFISILGSNFSDVNKVYVPSSDGPPYSATYFIYGNHIEVGISTSNHPISGPITLSGTFGSVVSPAYTITAQAAGFMCSPVVSTSGVGIVPNSSAQTVTGVAGYLYYWTFTGVAGTAYRFSSCSSIDNTQLNLYDIAGNQIAGNDDFGPACSGLAASLEWKAPTSGVYYILLSSNNCNPLVNNTSLVYSIFTPITPSISSISHRNAPVGTNVSIMGSSFNNVIGVYYHSTYGDILSSISKFSNHIEFVVHDDEISGTLTLTGLFGTLTTPLLSITGFVPSITGVLSIRKVPDYVTIMGLNFIDVKNCYFNSTGLGSNYTTNVVDYITHLEVFLPDNAIAGTLTLTGSFGSIVTSDLFIGVLAPVILSIYPLIVSSGNFLTISGSNINSVDDLLFTTNDGLPQSHVFDVYPNYLVVQVPKNAISGPLTLEGLFGTLGTDAITVVAPVTAIETQINNAIEIYPNPSSGSFTIKSPEGKITISNMFGSVVYNISTSGIRYLNGLLQGIYIVKFTTNAGSRSVKKLIIE
jgi:hypothetical protein